MYVQDGRESNGERTIPAASLLRVLDGVAVAAKAPSDFVLPLAERISSCGAFHDAQAAEHDPRSALSFQEWLHVLASDGATYSEELRRFAKLALGIAFWRESARHGISLTAADLDRVWGLVHDGLTGSPGARFQFTVSRSAQGFLAVPLCSLLKDGRIDELFRLHVWLPDGERGLEDVAIHSHQTFAQSWILAGSGTNHTYEVDRPEEPSLSTHAEYLPQWSDGKEVGSAYKTHQQSSTITNTGKHLRVSPIATDIHTRDMSYSVPEGDYHQTVVAKDKFHATLFFFDLHRGFFQAAGVAGPKNGQSYTQIRDSAGITSCILAQMADAARSGEKSKDIRSVEDQEP